MMFDTSNSEAMTHTPDLRALSAADASPGWLVLDAAREQQFTGEIVFDASHQITAYFDNGIAYHAVRAGDPSLCEQLLDAGIVDASQIDRGVVRVGGVEHLGRLFDRDPSVDRDAVTVFVELKTDTLLTELANRPATTFRLTAYRHHASGIHRWFVAPVDPAQLAPVGQVAQIDDSVTSRLPGLPSGDRRQCPDDVRIEWDQPDVVPLAPPSAAFATEPQPLPALDATMLHGTLDDESEVDEYDDDADESGWGRPVVDAALPLLELDEIVVTSSAVAEDDDTAIMFDEDFQILWPDGTEQELPASIEAETDRATGPDDEADDDAVEAVTDDSITASPFEQPPMPFDVEIADASTRTEVDEPVGELADHTEPSAGLDEPAGHDVDSLHDSAVDPAYGDAADAAGADTAADADADADADPDADADADADAAADADADPDAGSEADDAGTDVGTDAGTDVGTGADTNPQAEAPDAGFDAVFETIFGIAPRAEAPIVPAAPADEIEGDQAIGVPTIDADAAPVATDTQLGFDPEVSSHFWADVEASLEADDQPPAVDADDAAIEPGPDPAESPGAADLAFSLDDLDLNLPDWSDTAAGEPAPSPQPEQPALRFEMPPLVLSEDATPTEQQPDDVIDAVRRALAAIEAASTSSTFLPSMAGAEPESSAAGEDGSNQEQEPSGPGGFAPPTAAMSAEAVYARAGQAAEQTGGVASVVFVDDEPDEEIDERAGALRRLIGSLRRK